MYSSKPLIAALSGEKQERPPFWFMRQAGRYLPEYRALRASQKDFLACCYTPEVATEITLQPIRRFAMSGAIIFSDILLVPQALGADLHFEEGSGPVLKPITEEKALSKLKPDAVEKKLAPVYEALKQTKKALPPETTLIGFVGAPWTLACYMVEGRSGSNFEQVRKQAQTDKAFFEKLIGLLTQAVIVHAKAQIRAGAEVIQLFDSWAGLLGDEDYDRLVKSPAKAIVSALKAEFPEVPLIGFPRQSGSKFEAYAKETKIDAINVDGSVPLEWVRDHLSSVCAVQGCLDPVLLAGEKNAMLQEAEKILEALHNKSSKKPFIFNLGHGILPHTPIENVSALCDFLRRHS